ncbi:hypothetical protein BGZ93_006926 [Podila epicladia]|nr:hypothetical protein BGZ92_003055 [Podila epicladia]KAG0094654.1 hypothetical protein BGZ93_006926 [Podila epicladia]
MAANFWTSSHANNWILDRRRLDEAMREDLEYVDIATLTKIKMWYYNNLGGFDYDTSKLAEFEFYLLEELEFYLIVYHPYRDLTLIAKDLKLEESNLQTAWFVLNDSYRTDVCLLYAPHMIALAALYIICVVHAERFVDNTSKSTSTATGGGGPGPDESSVPGSQISHNPHNTMHLHTQLHSMASKKGTGGSASGTTAVGGTGLEGHGINNRNMVQWFADLNVDVEEIIEITQEMLSLYDIWKDYNEEAVPAMIAALKATKPVEPSTPQQQPPPPQQPQSQPPQMQQSSQQSTPHQQHVTQLD